LVAGAEGDNLVAQELFDEALLIDRSITELKPHNGHFNRALSRLLVYLGNLAEIKRESQTARNLFAEALSIDRTLFEASPNVSILRDNLCISLERLARSCEMDGNSRTASALLRESLKIKRDLLAQTQNNPDLTAEIMDLEHRIRYLG
jgi:tetratricopeptide (TPR) repeat protein